MPNLLKLLSVRHLPIQIILVLIIALSVGQFIPLEIKSFLYALSLTIKGLLLLALPVIVFSCVSFCMLSLRDRAMIFVLSLILAICCSNFISANIAYAIGSFIIIKIQVQHAAAGSVLELLPSWDWQLNSIIASEHALLAGFILGGFFSKYQVPAVNKFSSTLHSAVLWGLKQLFIPILPIFIFGFVLKMQYEGILSSVVQEYAGIAIVILAAYLCYLWLWYFIIAGFNVRTSLVYIKNMLPSALTGFSSMSSLAAMPVALQGVAKNSDHPEMAQTVLPASVNIHLIGDSIGIPILALAILTTFNLPLPSFEVYLNFAVFFVLAKFAVAAVPGGGILVMIPILEKYLGFDAQMSVLITSLYIMLDPIITATNISGNGAFSVLFAKIFMRVKG